MGLSENSVPLHPMVNISVSLLNGYNWGYAPFSDIPILGRWVACHKFHRVSDDLIKSLGVVLPRPIVWMLLLVDCGGCWIGVVLPPFHQTGLRPFLASYRLYTYSRAYSILNYIRRLVFKYFWGLVLKICGLMLKG